MCRLVYSEMAVLALHTELLNMRPVAVCNRLQRAIAPPVARRKEHIGELPVRKNRLPAAPHSGERTRSTPSNTIRRGTCKHVRAEEKRSRQKKQADRRWSRNAARSARSHPLRSLFTGARAPPCPQKALLDTKHGNNPCSSCCRPLLLCAKYKM